MRRILLLLATMSLTLSCQSKENPTPEKVVLTISPEVIEAEAAGGVFKVNAVCGEKPYIVGQSDWCEVTPSSVMNNACELTVNVSANDTYEPRSVQFSVVCADMKKYLKVNQAAAQEDLSFLD
ncbi:MAG: BACON domain-containing protein, partial [Candidatus Cryptobacteroides sp.]|nr:BACON domain-containing protein [Bacteroidales bacterium]MDY5495173.1 BACON domain-containing protein [Candidatus Cryptobacteroides sp.]